MSCEHGQLARSCEICELKAALAEAEKQRDAWRDKYDAAEQKNRDLRDKLAHEGFERDSDLNSFMRFCCGVLYWQQLPESFSFTDGCAAIRVRLCDLEKQLTDMTAERDRVIAANGRFARREEEVTAQIAEARKVMVSIAHDPCRTGAEDAIQRAQDITHDYLYRERVTPPHSPDNQFREGAELVEVRKVVDEQAEDRGLWFDAATPPEAYLQRALRRLHAAVEAGK